MDAISCHSAVNLIGVQPEFGKLPSIMHSQSGQYRFTLEYQATNDSVDSNMEYTQALGSLTIT